MTKIDIISGFLGAGKTTFIKKMLKEAFKGEQVVLIENEFGEIGIDGGFLKESGIEIREMNSGCICCSLVGDFGESLKEVVATYHPDRIIIEPSGVGKLSDVIKAVQDVQGELDAKLNSFTTMVDATKCRIYMNNFGEFFSNQAAYAGAIILSRTDKAKPEKIEESCQVLRKLNEKAPIITTPIEQLTGEKLLEIMEGSKSLEEELLAEITCPECGEHHEPGDTCGCGHDHHHHEHGHHHADEVFSSWGRETIRKYTRKEIEDILTALEKDETLGVILRAKGMVAGDGEWIYFDMVPEEHEVRSGAAEYTGRICVIGSKLNEAKLAELFKAE
ncbi:CobW family GTP-binding protein [Clostridium sp. C105KSO13]|uniref:CobW family GTP-binding protein n=1 Tax=Clostridium sp. C105KSO13 TaxID=1776045 RepID=UPI0007407B35|nr:GTP-binding protein [Clostridium sp. C105KSO13]CUX16512.1 putative GTP-binding protein YjiA [Clostridium sp. C105KSO13]